MRRFYFMLSDCGYDVVIAKQVGAIPAKSAFPPSVAVKRRERFSAKAKGMTFASASQTFIDKVLHDYA